ALEYPGMNDVSIPATAALTRALAAAEQLRHQPAQSRRAPGETDYQQAVAGLETAFRLAAHSRPFTPGPSFSGAQGLVHRDL
ncbi:MAG: hypothetical protein Q4P23_12660, partial [Micrococcaceae bacterium]|nr:hypothetical protein [Micrococcaceae bacterium]